MIVMKQKVSNRIHKALCRPWLALAAVAALGAGLAQAKLAPIQLTSGSYNANVVVGDADIGSGNVLNNGANLTATIDGGFITWSSGGSYGSTYYSTGYRSAYPGVGLPMGGTLTSAYDGTVTFAFQPVSGNNAAFFQNGGSVTLTLATPAAYPALAICVGCGGGGTVNYTINYVNPANNTSGSVTVDNWCGGNARNAYNGLSRVFETGDGWDDNSYRGSVEQINIPVTDTTDPIASITFTPVGNVGNTAIFGLSGTAPAPTPLAVTGWNVELIAAASATSPSAGTSQAFADNFCFFEQGAPVTGASPGDGFPVSGVVNSTQGQDATFQMQAYTGYDSLEGSGTLSLVSPAHLYNYLSLLLECANGGHNFTVTLNFSDSSTTSYSGSACDWTGCGPGAKPTALITQTSPWGGENYNGSQVHAQEVDFAISNTDSAKTVNSISLSGEDGPIAIFAVAAGQTAPSGPPASAPTILTVTTNNDEVSLTWSPVSSATSYNVKRSTTSGSEITIASPGSTSYIDTSVTAGTEYFYEVSAVNSAGEGPTSAETNATPAALPAPTIVTVTTGFSGKVSLTWTAVANVTGYYVERSTTSGSEITVASPSGTSYNDTGLVNGTTYYYEVAAYNGNGQSANSAETNATPFATIPTITPINISSAFNANGVIGTAASASGPDSSQGYMAGNWTYFAAGATGSPGGSGLPMGTTCISYANDATSFTLAPDSATNNVVWLQSYTGNNTATLTLPAPQAFSKFALLGGSSGGYGVLDVTINYLDSSHSYFYGYPSIGNWSGTPASTGVSEGDYVGDFTSDANNSNPSGAAFPVIGSGIQLNELDITPSDTTDPIVSITIVADSYGGGNNDMFFALSGKTNGAPVYPVPPAPIILTVTSNGVAGQVSLTWSAAASATSFNVKRSTTSGGETTIASQSATNYTDTGLLLGTTYYYVVSAVGAGGESTNSAEVSATPVWPARTPVTIGLSGWNAQIIAPNTNSSPSYGTEALDYGYVWYEDGNSANTLTPPGTGFPANNLLASQQGLGVTFQIQPYNEDNAIVLGGEGGHPTTVTLPLNTPSKLYNGLEFLVTGSEDTASHNPSWEVTLNFSDSTSSTYSTGNGDFTLATSGAAKMDVVNQSDTAWYGVDGWTNAYLFENDIPLTTCDAAKTVNSITIKLLTGYSLAIFAMDSETNVPTYPAPTTNAVIIADQFSGTQGAAILGRTPDTTDLPGVTWQGGYYPCCGDAGDTIDTGRGNPASSVAMGFDNYDGVSIGSVPSTYSKPTHFHVQADLQNWSMQGGDTVRGQFLGFAPAAGPNGVIGHQGANNISGLWISFDSGGYTNVPVLVLQSVGNSYLNWTLGSYTNQIIAVFDPNIFGSYGWWNGSVGFAGTWFTLGYDVDTVAGTITNITLSADLAQLGTGSGVVTQHVAGTFGTTFTDGNTMFAFVGSSGESTSAQAWFDNFDVVGLPAVYVAPPAQPIPANIVFAEFNGLGCGEIGDQAPDTVNLPGGTWSDAGYFNYLPLPSNNANAGNPAPCLVAGASAQAWVPIGSAGSYTEPTVLTIEADLELSSLTSDDAIRGIMLGFCSGTPANSSGGAWCGGVSAGHQGADNFAGIWFDPAGGNLYLQTFNASYLGKAGIDVNAGQNEGGSCGNFTDATNIAAFFTFNSSTNLGSFNANSWYHLSYQVDTTSGIITNIVLSNSQGAVAITNGLQILYASGDPGAVTLANGFNYAALQFQSSGGGAQGYVDNFGVSGIGAGIPPVIPGGLTAVATNLQITLNWSASLGATNYNVKRSTVSGAETTIATVAGTSYTDNGLNPNTEYYYVVSGVGIGGESANSSEASATTTTSGVSSITLQKSGPNLLLTWPSGSGSLLSATNLAGPWSAVPGASSPYTASPTNSATFFRLLLP